MRVQIHEPRGYVESVGVDYIEAPVCRDIRLDGGDLAVEDCYIGALAEVAAGIPHLAVLDENVKAALLLAGGRILCRHGGRAEGLKKLSPDHTQTISQKIRLGEPLSPRSPVPPPGTSHFHRLALRPLFRRGPDPEPTGRPGIDFVSIS
jgi:hypothetical protein